MLERCQSALARLCVVEERLGALAGPDANNWEQHEEAVREVAAEVRRVYNALRRPAPSSDLG